MLPELGFAYETSSHDLAILNSFSPHLHNMNSHLRLRGGVVAGIALQNRAIEQTFAKLLLRLVVGDCPLLRLAIGLRLAFALHPVSRLARRGRSERVSLVKVVEKCSGDNRTRIVASC